MLGKIDECDTASVNVLCTIKWVAHAWDEVKAETIKKCFCKAGILNTSFNVTAIPDATLDPFEVLDDEEGSKYSQLEDLVGCITCGAIDCLSTEFVHFDDDVPTCMEYEN